MPDIPIGTVSEDGGSEYTSALGNRRHLLSNYYDGVGNTQATQDYWYQYDSMNHFTVTMGKLLNSAGASGRGSNETDPTFSIVQGGGGDGVAIAYDYVSERTSATHYVINPQTSVGAVITETYRYTADGFLLDASSTAPTPATTPTSPGA